MRDDNVTIDSVDVTFSSAQTIGTFVHIQQSSVNIHMH